MDKFGNRYKDRCDKTTQENLEKNSEKAEKYPRDHGKSNPVKDLQNSTRERINNVINKK